jgi:hypothetical protein
MWCRPAFEPCTGDDMECCSGRCSDDALGFLRCLPIGGCRPSGPVLTSQGQINQFGEICSESCDCCSGLCEADDAGRLRCAKAGDPTCGSPAQALLADGEICETDCQCESNLCAEPRPPDAGGQYPKRCLDADPEGGSCVGDGEACVDPGECCEGPCLPDDDCGFSCSGSSGAGGAGAGSGGGGPSGSGAGAGGSSGCQSSGESCTTSTDCCASLACVPDGMGGYVCQPPPPN